jgi:hypothetical protein
MIFYTMGRIKVVAAAGVYRDTEKTHIAKASWLTKAYQATRYGHASNKRRANSAMSASRVPVWEQRTKRLFFHAQLKNWSLRAPAGDGIMAFNLDQSRKTTS